MDCCSPSTSERAPGSSSTTTSPPARPSGPKSRPGGHLAPVEGDEGGGERRRRLERGVDVPVARRHERHALPLALHDQADHGALHAAGRQPPVDAPPQHRRHLVAVEPVEHPPRLCRVDQAVVDAARVGHRLLDGGAGDLVEDHPLDRHPGLQLLEQVPGDGLAFAILVGGEVQLAGVLEGRSEVLHHVPAAGGQLVGRFEAVVDVDGQALRGQVGNVAHRGAHVEVVAQETGDGLRLGRRFDDHERSGHRALGKRAAITLSRRTPGRPSLSRSDALRWATWGNGWPPGAGTRSGPSSGAPSDLPSRSAGWRGSTGAGRRCGPSAASAGGATPAPTWPPGTG